MDDLETDGGFSQLHLPHRHHQHQPLLLLRLQEPVQVLRPERQLNGVNVEELAGLVLLR